MLHISVYVLGVFVCALPWCGVLAQDEGCVRICDVPNPTTCGNLSCADLMQQSVNPPPPGVPPAGGPPPQFMWRPAAPKSAAGVWGPCSKTCGTGTRTINDGANTYNIECNTQSCDAREGKCELDMVFVLDISTSLTQEDSYRMRQFVMDVISALASPGDKQYGLVTFSTDSAVEIPLQEYMTTDDAFDDIKIKVVRHGFTNTAAGVRDMRELLDGSTAETKVGMVLTDGGANMPFGNALPALEEEVEQSIAADITTFAIGFGNVVDSQLELIADYKDGFHHSVANAAALATLTDEIAKKACDLADDCDYDCNGNNPCTWANWLAGKHYFPYKCSPHKFIHCAFLTCWIKFCNPPSVFIPGQDNCGWPAADLSVQDQADYQSAIQGEEGTIASYDCGDDNPCTNANWEARKHYFPYKDDKSKYIHCDRTTCYEKQCSGSSVWLPDFNLCGYP